MLRVFKGAVLACVLASVACSYSYGEDSAVADLRKQVDELKQIVTGLQQTVQTQQQLLEENGIIASSSENSVNLQMMRNDVDAALAATRQTKPNTFNPSISAAIDTVGSYSKKADNLNAIVRGAEVMIQSNVDQFAHAYAVINAHTELEPVERTSPFEHMHLHLEEAAIETTNLPYGLKVKGGQYFADFSRLGKVHPHDRPFVDGPKSVDSIIGGEGKARGLEISWIPPVDHYFRWTFGAVDNIGAETAANNAITLLDGTEENVFEDEDHRGFGDVMYYTRLATIMELAPDANLHLGMDYARTFETDHRQIASGDMKLEWKPDPAKHDLFTWGSEALWTRQSGLLTGNSIIAGFPESDSAEAMGGYTYLQYRFGKYWEPGIRFDLTRAQNFLQEDLDSDGTADFLGKHANYTRTYSAYLGCYPSEYQRIRLQANYVNATQDFIPQGGNEDWQFFLQWTVFLGDHKHAFMP